MDVECPNCGNEYKSVGQHWSMSGCDEPEITNRQHQIITGLLLGDGSITKSSGRKPMLSVEMTNEKFINWLDNELGIISTGNILELDRDTSFGETKTYKLNSRRLNKLQEYRDWYSSGEKVFPDINLTPLILKVWYCCDGDISVDRRWNKKCYARLTAKNEIDRKKNINKMFESLPFSPNWNDGARFTFGRDGSKRFWSYIGEPLPGFDYKWPDND